MKKKLKAIRTDKKACGGKKCGSAFEWSCIDFVRDIKMAA